MRRTLTNLLAIGLVALLAGCASNKPAEFKLGITDPVELQKKNKAIVILSSQNPYTTNLGIKGLGPLKTNWSTKGATSAFDFKNFFITGVDHMKGTPRIAQVNPGKYNLLSFNYNHGTGKVSNIAGMRGLPLANFTIKAGEVLYIGNLSVRSVSKLFGSNKLNYEVTAENHSDAARVHLTKKAPALAAKMKTRMMNISPLLGILKKFKKKL